MMQMNSEGTMALSRLVAFWKRYVDEERFRIGLSGIAANRQNYTNIRDLHKADLKVFAQYGDDGIIDYLMDSLSVDKPNFVEIGVGDYRESNTRFVYQRSNSKGLVVDYGKDLEKKVRRVLGDYYWKGCLTVASEFLTKENIVEVLAKCDNDWAKADIFSLDVDGNDYWLLQEVLPALSSKVVILEFNPIYGNKLSVTTPYIRDFVRAKYHYSQLVWGASLKALDELMVSYRYKYVGTNLNGHNAYWVKEDLIEKTPLSKIRQIRVEDTQICNYCRDSRAASGELGYLSQEESLRLVHDVEVVDLHNSHALVRLGEALQ